MSKFTQNQHFQLVKNAIESRYTFLRNWLNQNTSDIDTECNYPTEVTTEDYKRAYKRGDVAARIVEIYPQETWKESPDVYEVEENEETEFETEWLRLAAAHNFNGVLARADILSGIGRFGIILIGINDGKELSQAVAGIDEKGVATPTSEEREITYLRTFDESVVTVKELVMDLKNPRYGQPKMYALKFQDPHVVGRVMMKLAGGTSASKMDYEQFLEQGREFKRTCDEKALDKFWATIINAGLSHPFPIWRVSEIIDWAESGEYERVMAEN